MPAVIAPLIRPLALLSALALMAVSMPAHAKEEHDSEEFEVRLARGQVTVVAKGEWHINQEYPWKLTVGDTKLDKTQFTLTEKDATVTHAPSGAGKIRGAVCSHDACHMIEREVVVP